jgi:hypothetical protein
MQPSCSPERLSGWEDRLAEVIAQARTKSYRLGEHDCFRLACAVVEALTGRDLWSPWAGTYTSKREALRRILEFSTDFTTAASKFFGVEHEPMPLARRGDVCEFRDPLGEQHLGIVLGVNVALLGPEGLRYLPRDACAHAWRIG